MVEELHPEKNLKNRIVSAIREESKTVTIASVSLAVAGLSLLVAGLTGYSAIRAQIQSELLVNDLTIEKNRTTLYIVYVQDLRNWMIEQGLEPPPLPEEN